MSKKIIIVSGGELDETFTLSTIEKADANCIIGVDKGMEFLYTHKILPDYIVGDFDSVDEKVAAYYQNETDVLIREYNPVKDASDTEIAVRLAMSLGCEKMLLLGATGGRIDHLWANVQTLSVPFHAGIDARILDKQNSIRLIGKETVLRREEMHGPYFSLFPLAQEIYGLNITGAKYLLSNHRLTPYDSLCVSNQVAEGAKEAVISFLSGTIILMETRDAD